MDPQDSVDVAVHEFARATPALDARAVSVTGRIRRTNFYLNRNAEEVFRAFHTSGPSYDLLAALYAAGRPYALTPTELYRGHMMSSAGVTARLDAAEPDGLVARSRDPRDRRGVIVTLTVKGQKLVREAAEAMHRRQAFVIDLYTEKEREQLLKLVKRALLAGERAGTAGLPAHEAAAAVWIREFPKSDPWLIEFLLDIALLAVRINRESEELLGTTGLSQSAVFILAALRRSPHGQRLGPRALADAALLSPAGLTAQLDQLEERGLLRRSPDPDDRRAIQVTLTRAGQRLTDRAVRDYLAGHERMLTGLTRADRQALATLLRKLLAFLEGNGQDHGQPNTQRH